MNNGVNLKLFDHFLGNLDTKELNEEQRKPLYNPDPSVKNLIRAEFGKVYDAHLTAYALTRLSLLLKASSRELETLSQIVDGFLNGHPHHLENSFFGFFVLSGLKDTILMFEWERHPWLIKDGRVKTFDEFYPQLLIKTHFASENLIHSPVVQANQLVEARYKLPPLAQQILRYLIAMIKPEQKYLYGQHYRIEVKEFARVMGRNDLSHIYAEMKTAAQILYSTAITIGMPFNAIRTRWIKSYKYHDGEGVIDFLFPPTLEPYLLQLNKEFTQYQFENVCQLRSQYAIRIYEFFKQYRTIGKREISLEELRSMLGVDNKYKTYDNMKRCILDPAREEIITKTDLSYFQRPVKRGRKNTGIEFYGIRTGTTLPQEIIDLIPEAHREDKALNRALSNYFKQNGQKCTVELLLYADKKKPKNYPAYVMSLLDKNFIVFPLDATDKEEKAQEFIRENLPQEKELEPKAFPIKPFPKKEEPLDPETLPHFLREILLRNWTPPEK